MNSQTYNNCDTTTSITNGDNSSTFLKTFSNKKSIAMLNNFQLKIAIKHNLSPSNVVVMPIEYVLRIIGGPDILNRICVNIFEYDSGSARKFNVNAYHHNDIKSYPPTSDNRVIIIGRRCDSFVEMLKRAYTNKPDVYGNESNVKRYIRKFNVDSNFGMALRFFTSRYTNSFEKITDSLYAFDSDSTFMKDFTPSLVIPNVISVRVIPTGDIIINGNKLIRSDQNNTYSTIISDPMIFKIKEAIVWLINNNGISSIQCCIRALVNNFNDLLIAPIVVPIDIKTCFGSYFTNEPSTRIKSRAASRILSMNRKHDGCLTMIGDAVSMVPVINVISDEETMVTVFNEHSHKYNVLHRIKYDTDLISFIESVFGYRYPDDLEQCLNVNVCLQCLNKKCQKK